MVDFVMQNQERLVGGDRASFECTSIVCSQGGGPVMRRSARAIAKFFPGLCWNLSLSNGYTMIFWASNIVTFRAALQKHVQQHHQDGNVLADILENFLQRALEKGSDVHCAWPVSNGSSREDGAQIICLDGVV